MGRGAWSPRAWQEYEASCSNKGIGQIRPSLLSYEIFTFSGGCSFVDLVLLSYMTHACDESCRTHVIDSSVCVPSFLSSSRQRLFSSNYKSWTESSLSFSASVRRVKGTNVSSERIQNGFRRVGAKGKHMRKHNCRPEVYKQVAGRNIIDEKGK